MSKKEEKEIKQNSKEEEVGEKSQEKEKLTQQESKEKNQEEEINQLKKDKLLLLAEIDNKQKEFRRQVEDVYKYSNKKFILSILDFLVDLEERALKAMRNDTEKKVKNHLAGIEMMRDMLWKNLENEGVKEIEIKLGNDMWNSYLHELDEKVEDDRLPEGTVTEVNGKGYLLHGQVLRPAKVKITKKTNK